MNIKLSIIKSSLSHSNKMTSENELFLNDLNKLLNNNIQISDLDDYDCDLKLIFIQTGGSEGIFLNNFNKLKEPFYLLTNGSNNSLAASLEILTYLKNNNLNGEILHGDNSYLVHKIKLLANQNKAINSIKNCKLGLFGKPSDWLISSSPNYELLRKIFGIEIVNLDLEDVIEKSKKFDFLNNYNNFNDYSFDKKEVNKSINIYNALYKICRNLKLDGFSIRCFDLLTTLNSTGCLALSKLNDEGIIASCEGDTMAMVSMLIASKISNQEVFQANPSRIDTINNDIIFAHCTIPLKMTSSYKLDTHFESGIGVAISGKLFNKNVTIFRLSSNLKEYNLFTGQIVENLNEDNLCRTQIRVHLNESTLELLTRPCGNHQIIFYGDYKEQIKELMDYYSIKGA